MPVWLSYLALLVAIIVEVIGTTLLGKSAHFTKLLPSLGAAVCYSLSIYLLAQALRAVPLAIAYASWGGLGIILTTVVSIVIFKQHPDTAALIGIALIVIGVIIVNGFSKMSAH
ncbi:DMT family transporter [Duffyella gerundensis]|uniref:DMT family transporter n=1 Tax=Duffyella TaxID=3026546 RepID=UPI003F6DF357